MEPELFIVAYGCPNCGESISDERLIKGYPCEKCLPETRDNLSFIDVCRRLEEENRLKELYTFYKVEEKLGRFENFFNLVTGFPISSMQRLWAKRLFLEKPFAIIAPPGIGKTTFGLVASLYNPKKSLFLVPTRLLVWQIKDKLEEFTGALNIEKGILGFTGKKEEKKKILEGNYDILVTTIQFFYRHWKDLFEQPISFVFIDDVDALLKSSSKVEALFNFLGYSDEDIKEALKSSDKDKREFKKPNRLFITSSATLKPKTSRVRLFQKLMGFSIQRAVSTERKIVDCYRKVKDFEESLKEAVNLINRIGSAGLLFLNLEKGRETVEKVASYLKEKGIKAASYLELSPEELISKLKDGSVEVAVGIAHPLNPLVRGLDLPLTLKYVIFLDVPSHILPLKLSYSPSSLYSLGIALFPLFTKDEQHQILTKLRYLRKYLNLPAEMLPRYSNLQKQVQFVYSFLERKLNDSAFMQKIREVEDLNLKEEKDGLYLVLGDVITYLQASGRVSRLTASGLTKGLAITLYSEPKVFLNLKKRLNAITSTEINFLSLDEIDIKGVIEEIEKDREKVGEVKFKKEEYFKTALVIVESPHKANTIASFWGKPAIRRVGSVIAYEIPTERKHFIITASLGHFLNLSRHKGFFGVIKNDSRFIPIFDTIKIHKEKGEELIDPEEVAYYPKESVYDKKEILKGLQNLAFEVDEVYIASDPDAEGEKIAYDLYLHLRPFNSNIYRLEFHEVTPSAFKKALENPKDVNLHRVKAQLTRRVLDRWVGFCLSRHLWNEFKNFHLSAGRVQTPVLGWVIEREKERKKKKSLITFYLGESKFKLEIEDCRLGRKVFNELEKLSWEIVETKEEEIKPLPPFTTDTILTEASRKLRLSASETMKLLQELFESGFITYHRTDSTRVSEVGRFSVARPFIIQTYGENFFYPRQWGEGGAHEAIRPTRPLKEEDLKWLVASGLVELNDKAISLYNIIFSRFIASQMTPAVVKKVKIRFSVPSYTWEDEAIIQEVSPGFNLAWKIFSAVKLEPHLSPKYKKYREVPVVESYTEGTLVYEMKQKGVGRPSTYAKIISTLLDHHYLTLRKGYLHPTPLGFKVFKYLKENFPEFSNTTLTQKIEEAMDLIEEGKADYQKFLGEIYSGIREISNC